MSEAGLVTLTPLAVGKLKAILADQGEEGSALRVLMVPAEQGVQYMLSLEKEATEDDITVEQGGIRVLVDRDSVPLIEGTSIDYYEDLMRAGFVIDNPNLPMNGCGCGGACSCGAH